MCLSSHLFVEQSLGNGVGLLSQRVYVGGLKEIVGCSISPIPELVR